jgi:hypothetical protein
MDEWLEELGIVRSAPVEVVHERPWSTVLRVPTADGDLYLKQCAPVQAFEVPLTAALAARWPDRVPEVVAADERRSWLLLRDGGVRLRELGPGPLAPALRLYAEIQVGEVAHVDELLRLGVPDVRLPLLAGSYEPFFEHERPVDPDELVRLRALAPRFRELCTELAAFGLPDSLQHDDLHDGNVFARGERIAIFDWGDSSVAHPLFSWLKPLGLATERLLDPEPLLAAYLAPWTAHAPEQRLREALQLALPVGSFAYVLQYQRHLDAMPPELRPLYDTYMPGELRLLLERLAG